MGFKITGLDELKKSLNKMTKAAEELQGNHTVAYSDLFNSSFMSKYTNFQTFEEFADAGKFDFSDLDAIDETELDSFIAANSSLSSWEDLQSTAAQEWAAKKLGF